jgi:hypothetical protein
MRRRERMLWDGAARMLCAASGREYSVRISASYRRSDVGGHVGRLGDALVSRLGHESIDSGATTPLNLTHSDGSRGLFHRLLVTPATSSVASTRSAVVKPSVKVP